MKAKNYEAIEKILHNSYKLIPEENIHELGRFASLVTILVDYLKTTSPRFDQQRFIAGIYKS